MLPLAHIFSSNLPPSFPSSGHCSSLQVSLGVKLSNIWFFLEGSMAFLVLLSSGMTQIKMDLLSCKWEKQPSFCELSKTEPLYYLVPDLAVLFFSASGPRTTATNLLCQIFGQAKKCPSRTPLSVLMGAGGTGAVLYVWHRALLNPDVC